MHFGGSSPPGLTRSFSPHMTWSYAAISISTAFADILYHFWENIRKGCRFIFPQSHEVWRETPENAVNSNNFSKNSEFGYVCAAHKNEKTCYSHSLRDSVLEEIVFESLKQHIRQVVDLSDLLDMTDIVWLKQAGIQRLQARLEKKQEEVDRCESLLRSLYENLVDEVIDRAEYQDLKKAYARRKAEAEEQAEGIRQEMAQALDNSVNGRAWMEQFRKNKNITSLDRTLVVSLIERILVFRDRRIEIVFRWQNEFHWQMELLERVRQTGFQKEAV